MPLPTPRNLLLIVTDQQRADTLACYGDMHAKTPSLDRLAEQSVVFERAYCCQPICTASRGCIMSGLWPHQNGATHNNAMLAGDVKTIAELIDPAYRRAYHGKWHLGDEIVAQHGFNEWVSIEDGVYRSHFTKPSYLERFSDYHQYLFDHGYCPDQTMDDGARSFSRSISAAMPYRFTKAGFLAQSASGFLRDHDSTSPFCLSVNFLEPHMPYFGPFNDLHDPAELHVGPAFAEPPGADMSVRNRAVAAKYYEGGFASRPLKTDADWRRFRANYLGLVTQVDKAVGSILDALDESGLADDTLVVFTSDHGEMMGDHAQLAKCVMYEESVRIPLLMRVPGASPRRVAGPISQIDLVPTLLDLMDQPVGPHLQGQSRRGAIMNGDEIQDDVFFIWSGTECAPRNPLPGVSQQEIDAIPDQQWRCIVTADGWKLNLCSSDPCNELFNLREDPHELHNRFSDPSCADLINELTGRIQAWQQRVGDPAPLVDCM